MYCRKGPENRRFLPFPYKSLLLCSDNDFNLLFAMGFEIGLDDAALFSVDRQGERNMVKIPSEVLTRVIYTVSD
mgnify:CR=1 FL=1